MAETVKPNIGDVYQALRPARGAPRTAAEQATAFAEYLKAIPYCRFSTIPQTALDYINLTNLQQSPELAFFVHGIRDRDLLAIFTGYYSADAATQNIVAPVFKRAFALYINDACRFDAIAADQYRQAYPDDARKRIIECRSKLLNDEKGNPIPLPEVDPNEFYLPDSFLLNRSKEKVNGLLVKNFITQNHDEVDLVNDLTLIVNICLQNHSLLTPLQLEEVIGILHKSKDVHSLIALLDFRVLTPDQHALFVKRGMINNNPNQTENSERIAVQEMYDALNELTYRNTAGQRRSAIVEQIGTEISREGFFPHRFIENLYSRLSEFNKTLNAPVTLPALLEYLETFRDKAFDTPDNYISGEVKLVLHDLGRLFTGRVDQLVPARTLAVLINDLDASILLFAIAVDAPGMDDVIPVYHKSLYNPQGRYRFPCTIKTKFFEQDPNIMPPALQANPNFADYDSFAVGGIKSFGTILAIKILRGNGYLNDARFLQNPVSARVDIYAGFNFNALDHKRFKTLFSTIQTYRAIVLFGNFYKLNAGASDFVQTVRKKYKFCQLCISSDMGTRWLEYSTILDSLFS